MPASESNESRDDVVEEQCAASAAVVEAKESSQAYTPPATSQSVSKRKASSGRSLTDSVMRSSAAAAFQTMTNISSTSSTSRMIRNIDSIFLNNGLIRVYKGAAEHALQCWITSSNTPYMLVNHSQSTSTSVGQQLVYWRICELDRGSRSLLGHTASGPLSREKEIMDAFHSVVLAFAAQWTPSWLPNLADQLRNKTSENKIRLALWERARDKLQRVADVDSFRVIFALIIFAWTEKPRQVHESKASGADVVLNGKNYTLDTSDWQTPAECSTFLLVAAMRKLLAIKFKIEGKKRRGICPWEGASGKAKVGHRAQSAASAKGSGDESMAEKIQSGLESKKTSTCNSQHDRFQRIEKCLWALEQLSDRSPSAAMAHEQMVKLTNGRRQGSLQQIPMASPPMKKDAASQSVMVGLSPDSDVGSNTTGSSFDTSTGGTDNFSLGSDNIQSALDAFLMSNAPLLSIPTPVRSGNDIGEPLQPTSGQYADLNAAKDYLQLLQMFEQPDASSHASIQDAALLPIPSLDRAASYGTEPFAILETLAELTKQPMPDILPLSSESASSSSSMDTMFSFDSAAAAAAVIAAEDLSFAANHQPRSSATSSGASSSSDSDDDDRDAVRKKAKLNHPAFDAAATPL